MADHDDALAFTVTHQGRGGQVIGRGAMGEVVLAIEMVAGGRFAVFARGATIQPPGRNRRPLRRAERDRVRAELRAWLDDSDRATWLIEG